MKFMSPLLIDCHTHIGVDSLFYFKGSFPYAQDFRALVQQAKLSQIDRLVVFPFVTYFGWQGLRSPVEDQEINLAVPYEYENRRMFDEIYDLNADIAEAAIPFAMFDPARQQEEQVAALRKLAQDYPIKGLKTQPTIIQAPIRELLEKGRCLMDLAEELDLPVLIHSSIIPVDLWSQASDILDVVETWPNVRFCVAHSCRFDLPSIQRLGTLPNAWMDCSAHCIHCDLAVDESHVVAPPDRRMVADYSRPDLVMKALYDLVPHQLIWGSDAPYYSYAARHDGQTLRLMSTYEKEVAALDALSETERLDVLHHNTKRFLGASYG